MIGEGEDENQAIAWQQVDGADGGHGGPQVQDNSG